jgi:hypothetical protein
VAATLDRGGCCLTSACRTTPLTVVVTCRQQGRTVLAYLTACCQAFSADEAVPSFSSLP